MATSPYSPKAAIESDEKLLEDKPLEPTTEAEKQTQGRESQSASPMLGKYRKKYEIENHSYLGIPGASVFAGVLQRDEVSILKEKKAQQQQEVKAALQLQIMEKQRRLEAEKSELVKVVPEGTVEAVDSPEWEESRQLEANPQSDETSEEPRDPAPPDIHHLYTEILKEHENLKAKVESQEAWIQQLIYRSISQTRNRSPLPKKPSPKPRSKKVQALSANQRRAHSSAAGLPIDLAKPSMRPSDFSLFLEESGVEGKGGLSIPVTSAATPVHRVGAERNLDAGGDSMFLYPSSKGVFEEWRHELKNFPTEEIPHRRETSVPRQRREKTPNLRFPKDVFPMNLKRRPALI